MIVASRSDAALRDAKHLAGRDFGFEVIDAEESAEHFDRLAAFA